MSSRYFRAFLIWSCLCPHNFTLLLQPFLVVCVGWFAGQQHRRQEHMMGVGSRSCGCLLPQPGLCLQLPGPHMRVAEQGGAAPEDRPKREIKCASPANDALARYWFLYKDWRPLLMFLWVKAPWLRKDWVQASGAGSIVTAWWVFSSVYTSDF